MTIIIGDFEIGEELDNDNELFMESSYLNKDDAIELIAHLAKVFNLTE